MNRSSTLLRCCGPLSCACLLAAAVPAQAQVSGSALAAHENESAPLASSSPGLSLGSLFSDTVRDFGRLGSAETLTWLGVGALSATFAHSIDGPTSRGLSGSNGLDPVFEVGAIVGGARFQFAGALATLAVGRATGSPKLALAGADLLKAQIMSQAITAGIKLSVRRTRPDGTRFSFPSGHTSVTFASATVLQRDFGWKVGLPAYGIATYVAASRIQEKRHFLSDVAFGAAVGILAGRTVTVGRGEGRFAVAPVAAPGGGGVGFTWIGRR